MPTKPHFAWSTKAIRISLREMLALVAFVALAIASLKNATDVWLAFVAAATMLTAFAALIVAVIDRGPRQAFAIGFSLVFAGYWAMLVYGVQADAELNFSSGRMPTTLLLRRAYASMREACWFDPNTRQIISDSEALAQRKALGITRMQQGFASGPYLSNVPKESFFMPIGQCWCAILLGYAGGRFARYVHIRRERDVKPHVDLSDRTPA
jgi:hypothetical protein